MKQSIGTSFMLNFIIVFIVVTFAFLTAAISYMKAFKVNNAIADSIEKYEGYNHLAIDEINRKLGTLGYSNESPQCGSRTKDGTTYQALAGDDSFDYCVYYYGVDDKNYQKYGIVTYLNLDLPIVNRIKVRIYSETEKMYFYG